MKHPSQAQAFGLEIKPLLDDVLKEEKSLQHCLHQKKVPYSKFHSQIILPFLAYHTPWRSNRQSQNFASSSNVPLFDLALVSLISLNQKI